MVRHAFNPSAREAGVEAGGSFEVRASFVYNVSSKPGIDCESCFKKGKQIDSEQKYCFKGNAVQNLMIKFFMFQPSPQGLSLPFHKTATHLGN